MIDKLFEELLNEIVPAQDRDKQGLLNTPERMKKAFLEWTSGYYINPYDVVTTFEAETCDEMIICKNIPFYSLCEHHLVPFFGTATIAYIPTKQIIGLSKFSRLLDVYAKRLQTQERITNQVADIFMEILTPKGSACLLKARHLCMESRGVCKQGHATITSALRGRFKDEADVRAEFIELAK